LQQFADQIGLPIGDLDAFEKGEITIDDTRLSSALERLLPFDAAAQLMHFPLPIPRAELSTDQH
jgi:hypothetical protein